MVESLSLTSALALSLSLALSPSLALSLFVFLCLEEARYSGDTLCPIDAFTSVTCAPLPVTPQSTVPRTCRSERVSLSLCRPKQASHGLQPQRVDLLFHSLAPTRVKWCKLLPWWYAFVIAGALVGKIHSTILFVSLLYHLRSNIASC